MTSWNGATSFGPEREAATAKYIQMVNEFIPSAGLLLSNWTQVVGGLGESVAEWWLQIKDRLQSSSLTSLSMWGREAASISIVHVWVIASCSPGDWFTFSWCTDWHEVHNVGLSMESADGAETSRIHGKRWTDPSADATISLVTWRRSARSKSYSRRGSFKSCNSFRRNRHRRDSSRTSTRIRAPSTAR